MRNHRNRVRGEAHHASQLTEQSVAQMRRLHYEDDLCIRCISKLYDVRYPTAWDAIKFNTWKHVRGETG